MTKLLEWLIGGLVFLAVWAALITDTAFIQVSDQIKEVFIPLPIYLLIVFACYSLASVGYGVMTFNDCVEAHRSLKKEVSEAVDDLKRKGMTM